MSAEPKPAKGTAQAERDARRRVVVKTEKEAKLDAKCRDEWMCRRCGKFCGLALHAAHIDGKGMGGDHGARSSLPSDYVGLCGDCHTGGRSAHSGHVRIEPRTAARGDGLVDFIDVDL